MAALIVPVADSLQVGFNRLDPRTCCNVITRIEQDRYGLLQVPIKPIRPEMARRYNHPATRYAHGSGTLCPCRHRRIKASMCPSWRSPRVTSHRYRACIASVNSLVLAYGRCQCDEHANPSRISILTCRYCDNFRPSFQTDNFLKSQSQQFSVLGRPKRLIRYAIRPYNRASSPITEHRPRLRPYPLQHVSHCGMACMVPGEHLFK